MYYKYSEIVKSLPKEKNKKSSLWVKTIIRKISFLFTWIFINLGFTANMVSCLSIIVVIIGSILISINNELFRIIGMILINFWLVLDCVDGNIARCKKESSIFGSLVDAIGGYYAIAFSYMAIGIAAYYTTNISIVNSKVLFIMLGAFASVADILSRLLYQKKENTLLKLDKNKEEKQEKKYSFNWLKTRIDKEIGISGAFMPCLIIATIFNFFDVMIIGYSIFNLLVLIFITVKTINIAEKEKKMDEIRIGYTTGVFDMFHIGHLNLLKRAKENCDYLIVGVSTDELVQEYKNKKTIIPFEQRIEIVKAIKYVDKVVPQVNREKFEAWKKYNFNVMFVGDDWKNSELFNELEKKFKDVGVEIKYFTYTKEISSTILREKLKGTVYKND